MGLDLSLTLLRQLPGLPRVAGDMCCFPFVEGSFDRVLNPLVVLSYGGAADNLYDE